MRIPAWLPRAILPLLLTGCGLLPASVPSVGTPVAAPTETAPIPGDLSALAEPTEAIQILAPGPGSRLTSPMAVRVATTVPAFENTLMLCVLLADGSELVSPRVIIGSETESGTLTFEAALDFEVPEEQPAFVQAFVVSPRDGGVSHLSSVGVTVLPAGTAEVRPAVVEPERLQILHPTAGESIRGGTVRVEGIGVASFEQTLVIEVLDAAGDVIGMQPALVQAPDWGLPGLFVAEVAYTTDVAGPGQIVVRDISPAHGQDVHRTSVEVTLAP